MMYTYIINMYIYIYMNVKGNLDVYGCIIMFFIIYVYIQYIYIYTYIDTKKGSLDETSKLYIMS